jgi:hypothetical protein
MMSVGCYDFISDEWIIGPKIVDSNYDPYADFYNDDMKYITSIITDIRNNILEIYELAIVIKQASDE